MVIGLLPEDRPVLVKMEAYHDGTFWCARGIREDIFPRARRSTNAEETERSRFTSLEDELRRGKTLNLS